jgi:AraC family transcriptional regulator of adaptative response/methylated-DNA-[protein]-cysteine methyltransferase
MQKCGKITLDDLARESGMSKFHFQKVFKGITGITPQQYKMARHDMIKKRAAERVTFAVGPCYLGHILVGISERGICAITLGDDPDVLVQDLQKRFPRAVMSADNPDFNNLVSILAGAAESTRVNEWELPLDLQGTAFQHRVWNSLRQIPSGELRTYSDIAKSIGCPAAVRAVASACAANPLAIAIPCHRVIRADNGIGGYRWGIERKKALWEMEKVEREDEGKKEFEQWVESCLNSLDQ